MSTIAASFVALTSLWSGASLGPAPVSVRQIAVGTAYTCAILNDQSLWCWGANMYGQLGLGEERAQDFFEPQEVKALPGVKAVAAGMGHTCAIDLSDRLWCWGNNGHGQVSAASFYPKHIKNLGKVKQIALGFSHTCAIDWNDDLWCWDAAGTLFPSFERLMKAKSIALGFDTTCAIDLANALWCWGGDIGFGEAFSQRVQLLRGKTIGTVTTGGYSACATDEKGRLIWCAGRSGLRSALRVAGELLTVGAIKVPLSDIAQLAMGGGVAYILDKKGSLKSLRGPGSDEEVLVPLENDLPVKSVSVGVRSSHACAIYSNGLSKCWGANTYGQLGYGAGVVGDSADVNNLPFHEFWR